MKLKNVIKPKLEDIENIVAVDREVTSNNSRRGYIRKAVEEDRCIVVKNDNRIVGFLIFDTNFFNCSFISLIIVSPTARRKGYATSLIDYFVKIASTQKVFSSTNLSNKDMQKVFIANGFVQSGVVENLDEGDPEIIYFKSK
ncbi:GNAT family N-acetyltransferase [Oceanobacillus chungangensis]|uniref:GNAT family N-acetyltransferase n=1 Tax=Oceanobacillus chungangensis TaxID=1229152 RepID=A0A3D8PMA9_9BACI|nr:GNAT family N-acetyltransferase [Oceanobacillus chungangensis]RDW17220.1 GNAT family N-acetyltransferase [Oceanobacillus chungangensis]